MLRRNSSPGVPRQELLQDHELVCLVLGGELRGQPLRHRVRAAGAQVRSRICSGVSVSTGSLPNDDPPPNLDRWRSAAERPRFSACRAQSWPGSASRRSAGRSRSFPLSRSTAERKSFSSRAAKKPCTSSRRRQAAPLVRGRRRRADTSSPGRAGPRASKRTPRRFIAVAAPAETQGSRRVAETRCLLGAPVVLRSSGYSFRKGRPRPGIGFPSSSRGSEPDVENRPATKGAGNENDNLQAGNRGCLARVWSRKTSSYGPFARHFQEGGAPAPLLIARPLRARRARHAAEEVRPPGADIPNALNPFPGGRSASRAIERSSIQATARRTTAPTKPLSCRIVRWTCGSNRAERFPHASRTAWTSLPNDSLASP